MKINIELEDGLAGFQFFDDENKTLNWEDMTRQQQIHVCNSFVSGYELFSKCIKDETGD